MSLRLKESRLGITNTNPQTPAIEEFIKPYRENIDKDMNQVLAYAPETMDKKQRRMADYYGSLQADITLATANKLFLKRENKPVDICLLNHGGIRSMISKGNVTTRTAFELMPFETIVVALKGPQIIEMVNYLISEKKPHPLAGMEIILNKDASSYKSITIQGKPLDLNKTYYVATNDYLFNGGDSMNFFKKGTMTSLDYKLRNVWVDYFKETDTIPVPRNKRIIVE